MDENIYQSPSSDIGNNSISNKRETLGRRLAFIGSLLQLPIFIGFSSFLISMIQTFLSIRLYGTGDSKVMAGGISAALVFSLIGCITAFPGLIISSIVLFISDYRSKWFFWYSIIASIFWLLSFPWGTAFGLIFLVLVIMKRTLLPSPLLREERIRNT